MNVTRILVPVDFSGCSMAAARAAHAMAERFSASVVLLHVPELPGAVQPDALIHPEPGAPGIPLQEYIEKRSAERFKPYRELFGPLLEKAQVEPSKYTAEVIIRISDEVGADMIVMGTHGRRGIQRLLMGSVTEKVLRQTTRPVLVIRGDDGENAPTSG
ncbi:MAG: universal stress protein [Myxococcota bacterium]